LSAGGYQQKGWRAGLRGLGQLAVAIFLIALFKRWAPTPLASGVAMFVTLFISYWIPPRPAQSFAGWLRACLLMSALMGAGIYLISFIGGADNIPSL
jgi:hypothetical protein